MIAKLKLEKQELSAEDLEWVKTETLGTAHAYPLAVSIYCNIDLEQKDPITTETITDDNYTHPANILVVQLSGTQFDPNQGDMFVKVADVTDMYELGTEESISKMDNASSTLRSPFYRTNTFKLFCRSIEEADAVWNILKQEAKAFISSYNTAFNTKTSVKETIYI